MFVFVVVRCLLLVACSSFVVVCYFLFGVWCLVIVDCCLLRGGCSCLLVVVCDCLMFVVCCL